MITVQDLVEALVGDVPFFETSERKRFKKQREAGAIPMMLCDTGLSVQYQFCTGMSAVDGQMPNVTSMRK